MAARVFFQQMREDPIEVEQTVRHTLNAQVLHLETELRKIIESLSLIRNRIQQELGNAVGSGLRDILNDGREAMTAETQFFHAQMTAPLEAVKAAVLASTTQAAESRKSTSRLLKAIEGLAEKIERTKAPTDGFKEKVDEFATALDRVLTREKERTDKNRQSADAILSMYKEMEARAIDSAVVMEECKSAVQAMRSAIDSAAAAAHEMVASGSKMADEMLRRSQSHIDLIIRVGEMSSKSEVDLRRLTTSLETQVQASAGALAALERNVVQASELIVRELSA